MPLTSQQNHYRLICVKGFETGKSKKSSEKQKEKRTEMLRSTMEHSFQVKVDNMYAEGSFIGTPKDGELPPIYTTKIFPSGLYHCECAAFKRTGAHRQGRPCKHATALARIALKETGI